MIVTPLKVAHLTTVDLSLRYLLMAQMQAVIDAGGEVIGISAAGPDVAYLEQHGIRHRALTSSTRSMNLAADVRAARELWRILREERPDVLHTHNPKPGFYGRIVGRLAGVPRVVNTIHGLYATEDDPWPKRAAVYAMEAIASRFSHVELCQNPEDFELLRRWRIVPRKKLRYLGNGVDLERFRPDVLTTEERAALRAELGFTDHEIVVGCVARLVAEKGVPELVEAVVSLGRPFRLLLVGGHDPEKSDALPETFIARALSQGVVVVGHRTDVEQLYNAMDVFCLASHREGFPRAAMEAAASGLPIVATEIRGCREVVDDGVTGMLVPVDDQRALATAIRNYVDPGARRADGRGGRENAKLRFDETDVASLVLLVYSMA